MLMRILCLSLAFFCLAGCEKTHHTQENKPLIVIISPDNPPFEFKDTAQGGEKVIGFDVDVIQKIAQKLGRPVQIIESDFSAIIPSIQSGRADIGLSAIAATEERRKNVDFSDPYYTYKFAFLVPQDSMMTSENDLQDKKLGVQLGSSHEMLAQKWRTSIPGLSLVTLTKVGELVQELKNGRIQAILTEDTTAHKIAGSTPGLKVVVLAVPGEELVIVFPKGSQWVKPVNVAIQSLKGEIEEISKKWMVK
jgi:ABC-type amino acid transport substrate-binding protein